MLKDQIYLLGPIGENVVLTTASIYLNSILLIVKGKHSFDPVAQHQVHSETVLLRTGQLMNYEDP